MNAFMPEAGQGQPLPTQETLGAAGNPYGGLGVPTTETKQQPAQTDLASPAEDNYKQGSFDFLKSEAPVGFIDGVMASMEVNALSSNPVPFLTRSSKATDEELGMTTDPNFVMDDNQFALDQKNIEEKYGQEAAAQFATYMYNDGLPRSDKQYLSNVNKFIDRVEASQTASRADVLTQLVGGALDLGMLPVDALGGGLASTALGSGVKLLAKGANTARASKWGAAAVKPLEILAANRRFESSMGTAAGAFRAAAEAVPGAAVVSVANFMDSPYNEEGAISSNFISTVAGAAALHTGTSLIIKGARKLGLPITKKMQEAFSNPEHVAENTADNAIGANGFESPPAGGDLVVHMGASGDKAVVVVEATPEMTTIYHPDTQKQQTVATSSLRPAEAQHVEDYLKNNPDIAQAHQRFMDEYANMVLGSEAPAVKSFLDNYPKDAYGTPRLPNRVANRFDPAAEGIPKVDPAPAPELTGKDFAKMFEAQRAPSESPVVDTAHYFDALIADTKGEKLASVSQEFATGEKPREQPPIKKKKPKKQKIEEQQPAAVEQPPVKSEEAPATHPDAPAREAAPVVEVQAADPKNFRGVKVGDWVGFWKKDVWHEGEVTKLNTFEKGTTALVAGPDGSLISTGDINAIAEHAPQQKQVSPLAAPVERIKVDEAAADAHFDSLVEEALASYDTAIEELGIAHPLAGLGHVSPAAHSLFEASRGNLERANEFLDGCQF